MSKPGRNEPCPCGSGRKYKHCCYFGESGAADEVPPESPSNPETAEVIIELKQAMADREFSSMEEAQTFINDFMNNQNRRPAPGFHGLSPDQMESFLSRPFDSPHLAAFNEHPAGCESAPVMWLFLHLAEAAGEKDLRATAKGNLPQKFCREAAQAYWSEEEYARRTSIGSINREHDFFDLHALRVSARLAGLIRKYHGRFLLTKRTKRLLDAGDTGGLYYELLRGHTRKYNWGYMDGYNDFPIIQYSFLFTLYLLQRYGDKPRLCTYYEDCFLDAFPSVLHEPADGFLDAETVVRNAYTLRTLCRFAEFFGLGSLEATGSERFTANTHTVKASPLLREVVAFPIG